MKKYALVALLAISACATPKTVLHDDATGSDVVCGGGRSGFLIGGAIGYSIQKDNDKKCVEDAKKMGLTITSEEKDPAPKDASIKPDSITH